MGRENIVVGIQSFVDDERDDILHSQQFYLAHLFFKFLNGDSSIVLRRGREG